MSSKRMRTQSSAAQVPDNNKKREMESAHWIGEGGRAYDRGEPEMKPLPAKEREKLGVTVGAAVYCGFEITPSFPSYYRPEIVFGPAPEAFVESETPAGRATASPSPAPASKTKHGNHVERLFICETCFKYTPHLSAYSEHANERCQFVHAPPGTLIYLSPGLPGHPVKSSVPHSHPKAPPGLVISKVRDTVGYALYEIDGEDEKLFCQNLSLFAKLWVGSKSVGYDVSGFMFYVLLRIAAPHRRSSGKQQQEQASGSKTKKEEPAPDTPIKHEEQQDDPIEQDTEGEEHHTEENDADEPNRIVGYFSKEKNSWDNNNLACILVFPPWQGKGIGQLLIEASYHLSHRENRIGGPERPLSTSGQKSYEAYWSRKVAESILALADSGEPEIQEVAKHAWIVTEDAISTLEREQWTEVVLEDDGDGETDEGEQTIIISKAKVKDWLASKGKVEGLEDEGWLFSDESSGDDEESEDEEDDSDAMEEDDEDEDEELEDADTEE